MSMGPMGMIGSIAGVPLTQAKGDADRKSSESTTQNNVSQGQTENAAGVGEAEQQSESSERDADGRRLWEGDQDGTAGDESQEDTQQDQVPPTKSKDPTGNRGSQLDISG